MQILIGIILTLLSLLIGSGVYIKKQGEKTSELELENRGLKDEKELQKLRDMASDALIKFRESLSKYRKG